MYKRQSPYNSTGMGVMVTNGKRIISSNLKFSNLNEDHRYVYIPTTVYAF